jgi:branched-chain amino acid transport system permease protein
LSGAAISREALSKRSGGRGLSAVLGVLLLLCLVPAAGSSYFNGLLTEVLIFAIAASSLNLLMGYTGLVSFGHASFFGVAAYGTIILAGQAGWGPWLGALAGIAVAADCAVLVGYYCLRLRSVAFFMSTLAFGQLFYSISVKWRDVTGGSDGIGGLARPSIAGLQLTSPAAMYYFALALFVVVMFIMHRLIGSQFGQSLMGIRENEMRMRSMGFATRGLKLLSFTLAGALAGVAGSLYALFNGFVSPESLSWTLSGNLLLMVVLGGAGSLFGPALGAAVFLMMKSYVSSYTDHWLMIIGLLFIVCVLFFREGIYGAILKLVKPGKEPAP